MVANDVLKHHGVKGMKWGVRKDGSIGSTSSSTSRIARKSTDVTVTQRPGKFVKTSGGKKQTASEDAVKIAGARQLAKKSTTDSLSTKQLQEAVNRMNLEQQYSRLSKQQDRRGRGARFVRKLIGADKNNNNNNNGGGKKNNNQNSPVKKAAAKAVGDALKKSAAKSASSATK